MSGAETTGSREDLEQCTLAIISELQLLSRPYSLPGDLDRRVQECSKPALLLTSS